MPHIRIRGLTDKAVQNLSRELPQDLAKIMQTSADNFTVEEVATRFYKDGALTEGDPMIEILWFDRGQEIKNVCAQRITELVKKQSTAEFIAVIFMALPKESYFENGKHF
jgi:phenylpyruvate tautomerase PptA (4-oxalocrotonate tautomerase family)